MIPVFDLEKMKNLYFISENNRKRNKDPLAVVFSDVSVHEQDVFNVSSVDIQRDIVSRVERFDPFEMYIAHANLYELVPETKGREKLYQSNIHHKVFEKIKKAIERNRNIDNFDPVSGSRDNTKWIGIAKEDNGWNSMWVIEIEFISEVSPDRISIHNIRIVFHPLLLRLSDGKFILHHDDDTSFVGVAEFEEAFGFVESEEEDDD